VLVLWPLQFQFLFYVCSLVPLSIAFLREHMVMSIDSAGFGQIRSENVEHVVYWRLLLTQLISSVLVNISTCRDLQEILRLTNHTHDS
jgi:hypothetical protein